MKKYMIFALSFLILYVLFQFLSGLFLTLIYVPDIEKAWHLADIHGGTQDTVLFGSSGPYLSSILFAFLAATIAYFIPNLITRNRSK